MQFTDERRALAFEGHLNRDGLCVREATSTLTVEGRFACCSKGLELADPYNGGAALVAFLAAKFGEGIHERLLRSGASTFDEALANETKPYSQSELLSRFRKWLADSK